METTTTERQRVVRQEAHVPVFPDAAWLPASRWYDQWKTVAEFCIALALLALALPALAVAAVLIKLTSRGPVFYKQTRMGRHGNAYLIWKLRTMEHNCERRTGARWATSNDPRITKIGRFLRKTHLDELPQLWNILCGDMGLIGPRPERPEFIPELARQIPFYRARLLVRPGLTGLAQVQLPPDTDVDSVRRKLLYDLYYVRHANPWLDLRIMAATVLHIFRLPAKLLCSVALLPNREMVLEAYHSLIARKSPKPLRAPLHVPAYRQLDLVGCAS
jgi:lipopolysaccharide/colanic/teichoic acid biosynthesis glycosyltransferase